MKGGGEESRRAVPAWPALAALLALWSGTPAVAETLSLGDAVALARRENPALEASRARHDAARQASREARLARLPGLEFREIGVRTTSPADVFGLQLMQERFSFPAFTSRDPNRPDPLENFTSQVEATLPLFTGGQLSAGIGQAARMADAAEAIREQTERGVELGVHEAYLGALLARQFVELAERARQTTARHVARAQDFFEAGMMVESDLLEARVQLSAREENVIRARNAASLAGAGLNQAIGVDLGRVFELEAPASVDTLVPDEGEALSRARESRADLRAVRYQVAAARAGITRSRAEYWPQVGLAGRYVWNDDVPFGGHGDSYTIAAVLQWKVWNWGQTAARVARSRQEYAAALADQRSYQQRVEFEVRRARQAVDEAVARGAVTRGGVAAAERALVIVEDRFDQGVARMTDLLDAETRAHEARVRETEARFDLMKAARTLRFALGLSPMEEESR